MANALADLTRQTGAAFTAAQNANASRYSEILQLYKDRLARLTALTGNAGAQNALNIHQQFAGLSSRAGQDLVSRGLSGTTVAPTVQAGIAGQEANAQANAANQNAQLQAQIDAQASGQMLDFMGARTDAYPDMNGLASAAQQYGRFAGGGQAGTAAGGGFTNLNGTQQSTATGTLWGSVRGLNGQMTAAPFTWKNAPTGGGSVAFGGQVNQSTLRALAAAAKAKAKPTNWGQYKTADGWV